MRRRRGRGASVLTQWRATLVVNLKGGGWRWGLVGGGLSGCALTSTDVSRHLYTGVDVRRACPRPGRLRPGLSISYDVRSFSPPQRFERGAGPRQAGEVCSREGPSAPWPRAPLIGAPCPLHRSCEWPRTVKKNIGASRSPWRPSQVGAAGGDGKPAYFSSVGVWRWARRATTSLDRSTLTRTATRRQRRTPVELIGV